MSPDSLPVKLRQARGTLTISQAAVRCGVAEERIRDYEEGSRRPYGKTLKRLADGYGFTVPQLLGSRASGTAVAEAPPPRRRRRRRNGDSGNGAGTTSSVQVPVAIGLDRELRLLIEVVIQPSGTVHASVRPSHASRDDDAPSQPPAARILPDRDARDPLTGRGDRSVLSRPTTSAPRPAVHPESRAAAAAHDPQVDPLVGFRDAYRDFRRERK